MADERVLQVQQWLNKTYGNDSRYNKITEDGKTGWSTIYALRRALQIELGIQVIVLDLQLILCVRQLLKGQKGI